MDILKFKKLPLRNGETWRKKGMQLHFIPIEYVDNADNLKVEGEIF